jgi:hypothetical protein
MTYGNEICLSLNINSRRREISLNNVNKVFERVDKIKKDNKFVAQQSCRR